MRCTVHTVIGCRQGVTESTVSERSFYYGSQAHKPIHWFIPSKPESAGGHNTGAQPGERARPGAGEHRIHGGAVQPRIG